jgi:general secretion pathway protein F
VTIEQLIALNEELAALIRAGIPLDRGLIDAGKDLQGRLGSIVGDLGERLGIGESLPEALAGSKRRIPELYRAIVEAGIRSGRLSEALEGMASLARNYAESRRALGLAMLYPLALVNLAYALTLVFILQIAPRFVRTFEALDLAPLKLLNRLAEAGDSVAFWGPIPPLLMVILAFLWLRSGRAAALESGGILTRIFRRLPVVGSMIRYDRAAHFADLLALLIDHQVPLDQAVELAGRVSGNASMLASSQALAQSIRDGQAPSKVPPVDLDAFPPLLAFVLSAGRGQGDLASALRHTGWAYRRKSENRGEFLRGALPILFLLTIGASAVALYAMLLFIPMSRLWDELTIPLNY